MVEVHLVSCDQTMGLLTIDILCELVVNMGVGCLCSMFGIVDANKNGKMIQGYVVG